MKRLTLISLILGMVLTSCKEYGEEQRLNSTKMKVPQKQW